MHNYFKYKTKFFDNSNIQNLNVRDNIGNKVSALQPAYSSLMPGITFVPPSMAGVHSKHKADIRTFITVAVSQNSHTPEYFLIVNFFQLHNSGLVLQ